MPIWWLLLIFLSKNVIRSRVTQVVFWVQETKWSWLRADMYPMAVWFWCVSLRSKWSLLMVSMWGKGEEEEGTSSLLGFLTPMTSLVPASQYCLLGMLTGSFFSASSSAWWSAWSLLQVLYIQMFFRCWPFHETGFETSQWTEKLMVKRKEKPTNKGQCNCVRASKGFTCHGSQGDSTKM